MLTAAQKVTLAAALRAETNAAVVAAMAIRNDVFLTEWCNSPSATDAWNPSVDRATLFDLTNITKFDGLTAGKRDAWKIMMDNAPVNATKAKIRKAPADIWGASDGVAVLQGFTVKATNAQVYLGGTSVTENTVTAMKMNFTETIGVMELSEILNAG